MAGEPDDLDKLFESVADGESVDWDALERDAPDEQTRALIRQLRLIADVAEVHRSQVDEATPADVALTAPAGDGLLPIQPAVGRRVLPALGTSGGGAVPLGNVPPGKVPPDGAPPGGQDLSPNLATWGHLLLVRKIGEGSYGEVFHAHDTWLDHPVALKLLKAKSDERRVEPSDLLHEARKLARVRHDNVVTVHGADRHNGRVGFWMDFIDGETLGARLVKGRLSAGEASSVGQEVCQALAAVHRANIIHRDVKAQNVMRAHDGGRIILMDFGAGEFLGDISKNPQGTPLYMAPELFEGAPAGVRTDIYAAGVLLFHLVTNAFPVNGASMQELRDAHRRGERRRLRDERPDLPDSFIAIVERAIDPDPMRRYATAGDMEAKLSGEPVTKLEPVPSRPVPPIAPRPTPLDYAKRALAAGIAVLALTGLLGFVAARAFEVALRIDPDFYLGITDIFTVGAQALLPFATYWVLGSAAIAVVFGLRLLAPARIRGLSQRLISRIQALNAAGVATIIFLAGAGLGLAITLKYWDVFAVLWALREDPLLPATSMSILDPASRSIHEEHGVYSALLSFSLGLVVWRLFPILEKGTADLTTLRTMKWGTAAVALLVVAVAVAPRRAVWDSYAVASFDNHSTLVIGTTASEFLLYAPNEPDRPRFRVRKDAPGIRLTGETRALFDRKRLQVFTHSNGGFDV